MQKYTSKQQQRQQQNNKQTKQNPTKNNQKGNHPDRTPAANSLSLIDSCRLRLVSWQRVPYLKLNPGKSRTYHIEASTLNFRIPQTSTN